MGLSVERITDTEQVVCLAPTLVDLLEASGVTAPHYRPVGIAELLKYLEHDRRFPERALLVALHNGEPVGWCHLEPLGIARTAGDLYPYVGGQVVFQPGVPHVRSDEGYSAIVSALLYTACQIRSQQGAKAIELFTTLESAAESALRREGFQPVDRWATYVTWLAPDRRKQAAPHGTTLLPAELEDLPARLSRTGMLEGTFETADLVALTESFPDFDPRSIIAAEQGGELIGYVVAMIDSAYVSATGRKRAWVGFGPLGLGLRPGPEHARLGTGRLG
ncbi:MAG: hypothetical protein ACUVX8_15675 [Candidatus Zipacnadales bacterium]